MDVKNLKPAVEAAKELGSSYQESANMLMGFTECVKATNDLYDHGCGGLGKTLISFGFALFVFPEPTFISDIVGCGIMGMGFAYNKIVPPPIYVDDIFKTIEEQVKVLHDFDINIERDYKVPLDFSGFNFEI
jgi:hypothetical protein